MRVFQKYGFECDGVNGGILFSNFKPSFGSFTIAFWIKLTQDLNVDSNNNWRRLITFNGWNPPFFLFLEEDKTIAYSFVSAGYLMRYVDGILKSEQLSIDVWSFLVYGYDSKTGEAFVYKDGVLSRRGLFSQDGVYSMPGLVPDRASTGFEISHNAGTPYPNGNGSVPGVFGEVRIYDRALTDAEVQYLYKGGHIEDSLVFWLYPNENDVILDSDGETVIQVTERINNYVGVAYDGVKLVDGKDIDKLKDNKRMLVVKRV